MYRAICALAAAACLLTPAMAGQKPPEKKPSNVEMRRRDGTDYRHLLYDSKGMITPYPLNEQRLGGRFYSELYRLTPKEYYRLRKSGFTQEEVYMIANAARETGLHTSVFMNALYQGATPRRITLDYDIWAPDLLRVLPEWKTAAWAAATGEEAIRKDKLSVFY